MKTISLRDPSNCVFVVGGEIYRSLDQAYLPSYHMLMQSGLYKVLSEKGLLVSHEEVDETQIGPALVIEGLSSAAGGNGDKAKRGSALNAMHEDLKGTASELGWLKNKVLKPERIPFISYPYEWSFSQLKDAALATLEIEKIALEHGMTLKDASAYNMQFHKGKPLLLDTGSFDAYREGRPWIAYSQFLRHFLAPLVLMAKVNPELNKMLLCYSDGLPLPLVRSLMPWYKFLNVSLATHILGNTMVQKSESKRIHDEAAKSSEQIASEPATVKMPKQHLLAIIDDLERLIKGLSLPRRATTWSDYYQDNSYSKEAADDKKATVERFIATAAPRDIWDLGANNGLYSRLAASTGAMVVSMDLDWACVDDNYLRCCKDGMNNVLPLVVDFMVPSPAAGWSNKERQGLAQRGPADLIMALALVHHLSIGNNISLKELAARFSVLCRYLLIEFVPKSDVQVKRMLAQREDIFGKYDERSFEDYFSRYFSIEERHRIKDSGRTLYLLKSLNPEISS